MGRGGVTRAIDVDVLRQEISAEVVEGPKERYQFTWPDKKKSVVLANQPSKMTLRLDREKSVGRDGTSGSIDTDNIYIEGDNLDALKILRETYLGKVKMIYIDPPYNTGNDSFVYDDDFSAGMSEEEDRTDYRDEDGNIMWDRTFKSNPESNGRFHTDWLNMLYPRLRIAKDLLADDGVIFISIDDNEQENLKKICDEILGHDNFVATFPRLTTKSGKTPLTYMISHDYIFCYTKSRQDIFVGKLFSDDSYKFEDEYVKERGKYNLKQPLDCNSISYSTALDYPIEHDGVIYYPGTDYQAYLERKKGNHLSKDYAWRWSKDLFDFGLKKGWIVFQNGRIYTKGYLNASIEKKADGSYTVCYREKTRKCSTIDFISNEFSNDIAKKQYTAYGIPAKFDYPKPANLILELLTTYYDKNALVMDFFSGSASTADAVMQLNADDGGHRRFIMVQLPEECDENSESYKAGYKTICEIGEERIRRAGKKIKEESPLTTEGLDVGFRVFRIDSSNMKDVYYRPADYSQEQMEIFADNIKEDRTPEDLLFQVMLELGIMLSSDIEETEIAGKRVFSVADGYLMACFDSDVTDETVTEIAKRHPFYAVFRDSGMVNDSVMANFEQIFEAYSPNTKRKVL